MEHAINYDEVDNNSSIIIDKKISKIRKLNRKIGDNLKLLYGYRCQICGCLIGENYGAKIAEAHHIDYFTRSLNNNSDNLLILCPNHHRIIHNSNPIFDRKKLIYKYPNGFEEGLLLNKHLRQ
jgi:predicted restriction endonuclease